MQGCLTFISDKNSATYSVSNFNLGGLELCSGGLSPPKSRPGDGTAERNAKKVQNISRVCSLTSE